MTQRDLQPVISDGMDGCDMRQETRDLVHLGGGRRWNAVPTATPPHGRAAVPSAAATERGPPAWRAAILAADGGGTPYGEPPSGRRTAVERRPYRMMMQAPDGSAVAAVVSSAPPTGRAQERTLAFNAYFAAMAFPFVPSELRGRTAKMSTFPAGSSAFGISSVVTPPCGSCPMPALTPSK